MEVTGHTSERDADPDDSIPRIAWSRYVERDGRLRMHVTVEVNHRLVDGLHIGRFCEASQRRIDAL